MTFGQIQFFFFFLKSRLKYTLFYHRVNCILIVKIVHGVCGFEHKLRSFSDCHIFTFTAVVLLLSRSVMYIGRYPICQFKAHVKSDVTPFLFFFSLLLFSLYGIWHKLTFLTVVSQSPYCLGKRMSKLDFVMFPDNSTKARSVVLTV